MPPNNDSDQGEIRKLLKNICKLQDDQKKSQDAEHQILVTHLEQMNKFLAELNSIMGTNVNIAKGQKSIPFDTGSVTVPTANLTKPTNPDGYPAAGMVNVYALHDSTPIQYMTLINNGPGDIYFVTAYSRNEFNTNEGLLHPNDQRELFNVYEVRLRVTQPLTSYRLMEGTFRTGSFAPATKANTEIRPTLQANETLKIFDAVFEVPTPIINITSPGVQNIAANYTLLAAYRAPLPPGATATFVDATTLLVMPYLIPSGFILEAFAFFGNTSTDCTLRIWAEPVVNSAVFFGVRTFTLKSVLPFSARGIPFNFISNINFYSTEFTDPTGAPFFDLLGNPAPGRYVLFTITNDDPFNNMIGDPFFVAILRRLV